MRPSIRTLSLVAILAGVLAAGALGTACTKDNTSEDSGQVKVTATLGLFADLVQQVGGDRVQVSTLIPSGTDVHTYEPPPSQIAKLSKAKLVVMNGLDLEAGLERPSARTCPLLPPCWSWRRVWPRSKITPTSG
jgi:ABC-type Zn uptake system ZnuABC Zn-binding protein ZnuA